MEDKTHTVYLHINPKNKKVYVGITNQNVYKRWKKMGMDILSVKSFIMQ